MAEQPLNLEQFFISRNEIATKHNNKLEYQAMERVRAQLAKQQAEKSAKKSVIKPAKVAEKEDKEK